MKLHFLGTGTSTGIPQIGCKCPTCLSSNRKDRRLRSSAIVTTDAGKNILIDCGPDFYHQILSVGSPSISALLITHSHYDHVGGMDDLRPYCAKGPFPVYCSEDVAQDLKRLMPYSFKKDLYPGVPTFDVHIIHPEEDFEMDDTRILALRVWHYRLGILGFRFGKKLGYVTDCKTMPESTINALQHIDTLVVNALRHEEHLSHLTLKEALKLIEQIQPRVAYLTHVSHQMGLHEVISKDLPDNVHLAYDGLEIQIP